jgi:protein SCO1/2
MQKFLIVVLVLVTLGTAGLGYVYFSQPQQELRGTALDSPHYVGDVRLDNSQFGEMALSHWQGDVTVVFFGFTRCPDVCPMTMSRLADIYDALENRDDVQVVMITVDPMHDTPDTTQRYVEAFHPEFVGLSGTSESIAAAARQFYIGYRNTSDGLLSHTDVVVILDRDSNLRMIYGQDKLRWLERDLQTLVADSTF